MSTTRKLTQPLRPAARYRKGQAPTNLPLSDSDEDEEQQQLEHQQGENEAISDDEDQNQGGQQSGTRGGGRIQVSLREVEVDQAGQVRVRGRTEVGRTQQESSEEESQDEEQEVAPKPRFTGAGASKQAGNEQVSVLNG